MKQVLKKVKGFFETEPIKVFEKVEIKFNGSWRYSDFEQVIGRLNWAVGNLIYKVDNENKAVRYYVVFAKLNVSLCFFELIYFTFCKKQDLLGFISTGMICINFLTPMR